MPELLDPSAAEVINNKDVNKVTAFSITFLIGETWKAC
jgi:hypothetical protein